MVVVVSTPEMVKKKRIHTLRVDANQVCLNDRIIENAHLKRTKLDISVVILVPLIAPEHKK